MFWNKFQDFKDILFIQLDRQSINKKYQEEIIQTFEDINDILRDPLLCVDTEKKVANFLSGFVKVVSKSASGKITDSLAIEN